MAGVLAFVFSTVGITFFGEIIPQAYFSRNAMRAGSLLAPVIKVYQFLLYPVARPSSWVLDKWIGQEGPLYFAEKDFEVLLDRHIRERDTDISYAEGRGAMNFLRLDDLRTSGEGAPIHPDTIIETQTGENGLPMLDPVTPGKESPLVNQLKKTELKWAILTNEEGLPKSVLNIDEFLRKICTTTEEVNPHQFCHIPIVIENPEATLDQALTQLVVEPNSFDDRLLDREVILYWGSNSKRIVSGPDLLGRLLHGIASRTDISEDNLI
ncbi:MAG: DUF21 domain-containing protein [Verrucomicrobiales bacterium]|nr:DUF21 domain-containing protein [Verrucomicrobiales bacterium]